MEFFFLEFACQLFLRGCFLQMEQHWGCLLWRVLQVLAQESLPWSICPPRASQLHLVGETTPREVFHLFAGWFPWIKWGLQSLSMFLFSFLLTYFEMSSGSLRGSIHISSLKLRFRCRCVQGYPPAAFSLSTFAHICWISDWESKRKWKLDPYKTNLLPVLALSF